MLFGFWPIYKRELREFFQSASTYVALGLLFLVTGTFYHQIIEEFVNDSAMAAAGGPFMSAAEAPNVTEAVIGTVFQLFAAMILFTIPILTMRMIAAERSSGTFEVLVTCPTSDWGLLLGKYFALVSLGVVVVALCGVYSLTTYFIGRGQGAVPELRVVLSGHIGLLLIFSTYGAFGLMASAFANSQVTASIVTLIGLLGWIMVGELSVLPRPLYAIALELSALRHTEEFISGSLTLRSVAFYGLASFLCLFVAARVLEARRWRI